jgi:Zn-finger nucleic acid-binding protein
MIMCPICKNRTLRSTTYDETLPVHECPSCGGAWLRANEYGLWLRNQTPGAYDFSEIKGFGSSQQIIDSKQAAFCPDCGHFMMRYQIGSTVDFHLDRCNHCNGAWFDRNEWQALKAADLHDEIHRIFTRPWQQQIRAEEMAGKLDALYREKFGETDYEKIKQIRAWLDANPNRNTLLAYLTDRDPYTA